MKVLIVTDVVLRETNDHIYLSNAMTNVLKRYYENFGEITFFSRHCNCNEDDISNAFTAVDDLIENRIGFDSLKKMALGKHNKSLKTAISECDLVVVRVPSLPGFKAVGYANKQKKPCFAEVVGCPWDSYWNYSIASKPLAPIAWLWMKKTMQNVDYAIYVTEKFLQNRYPCHCESTHCSNVKIGMLDENTLRKRIEKIQNHTGKIVLLTAGAIDVKYKGQEYVIRAIPEMLKVGIDIEYRLAGAGDKSRLHQIACECGGEDRVTFLGMLSRDALDKEYEFADIYIQPSLQEGLPRSVIEAMSHACPCIGAKTAGIPELLQSDCVVRRKSSNAISSVVVNMLNSGLKNYAFFSFEKAKDYEADKLEARRNACYEKVKSSLIK